MPPVTPSPFRFITNPSQKPKSLDPTPGSTVLCLHSPPAYASTPTPIPKPATTPKPQFAPAKRFHIPTPQSLPAPTPPPLPLPATRSSRAQTPNSASPPFPCPTRRFHVPPPAPASTPAPARARFSYAPGGSSSSTQPTTPAPPPRTTLLFKKSYQRDSIDADIHSQEEPTSPLQKKRKLCSGSEDIENASSPPPSPHESDTEEFQVGRPRNRFLSTPTTTPAAAQGYTIINYHRSIQPPPGAGGGGVEGGEEAIPLDWSPAKTRAAKRWTGGGLAAEVAGWVLERSALSTHAAGGGRLVVARVKSGDGVFVVKGEGEGEGGFLLPIVGGGIGGGLAVGSLVVYGLPWWEVFVDGVRFRFLVTWRVEVGGGGSTMMGSAG